MSNSEITLYQTEDGQTKIEVRLEEETVWLSQKEMSDLFQIEKSVITKHINNVCKEGELEEKSNVQNLHISSSDRPVKFYNLDVIISVGYRVKSHRGTQFRMWATNQLREYLIKGFVLNDEKLKETGHTNQYFDELLERIRDIRSSEKIFYAIMAKELADAEYDKYRKKTIKSEDAKVIKELEAGLAKLEKK